MPVGRRHRVVVIPIAHQRQRADPARLLLASIVRRGRKLLEGGEIVHEPLANGLAVVAAQPVVQPLAALIQSGARSTLRSRRTPAPAP